MGEHVTDPEHRRFVVKLQTELLKQRHKKDTEQLKEKNEEFIKNQK
jgi:hypothetical protein